MGHPQISTHAWDLNEPGSHAAQCLSFPHLAPRHPRRPVSGPGASVGSWSTSGRRCLRSGAPGPRKMRPGRVFTPRSIRSCGSRAGEGDSRAGRKRIR